jgi:predicted enzyme related to lactoylglutathione lyase
MGQRTEYTPGTFSWTDLTTSDQDGAKTFYTALFGWDVQDNPMGDDGSVYSMMLVGGDPVAAISPQQAQQREAGVPPMWNSYVSVADADAAAARAGELGATVQAPPFDVLEVGRMAVIADPQGAFFEIWQPKAHIGAGRVNGHGLLSWNELHTTDLEGASSFYRDLFGWTTSDMDMGGQTYRVVSVEDHGNGGISTTLMPGAPPHWLVYFGTDDLDASVAKIGELGGTVVQPPMDIGEGNQIAVAQDPQGAWFALYAGNFED